MSKIILFCLFSGILGEIGAELSDERRCADQDCSDSIKTVADSVGGDLPPTFDPSTYPVPENPYKDGFPDLTLGDSQDDINTNTDDNANTSGNDSEGVVNQVEDLLEQLDNNIQQPQSADVYSQSAESFTQAPDVYSQSYDTNTQTADAYSESADVYSQSADTYTQAPDVYSQSADTFTQAPDAYSQSADTYTQAPDAYSQSADTYTQAPDAYSQSADTFTQAPDVYSQSADTYNQPSDEYSQSADTYNQVPDVYSQSAGVDSQSGETYTQSSNEYIQSPDSYAQSSDVYNQLPDTQSGDMYSATADSYVQPDSYNQQTSDPYANYEGAVSNNNEHSDSPITGHLMTYMPDWLHAAAHEAGGLNGDRAVLLVITAFTLILVHLITVCIGRSTREKPLLAKVAELDRKLFQSSNELLLLKKETSESGGCQDTVSTAQVRELEIQLEQANLEKDRLENHSREMQTRCSQFQEEIYRAVAIQQEKEKECEIAGQEKELAQEEARQAQEMVEEMINSQNNNQQDHKLIELVQKLQQQLESQQTVLKQYEPKLKKKEKEAKELTKELKQMRADKGNAELARDKLEKQVTQINKEVEEKTKLLDEKIKNESEWQSLSDLLQQQLDQKSEHLQTFETESSSLKSRINVYQNELDEKEEQLEILQETINQLNKNKGKKSSSSTPPVEGDGWEVDGEELGDGWDVDEDIQIEDEQQDGASADVAELAKLKVTARRASTAAKKLTQEVEDMKKNLDQAKDQLTERETECEQMRVARDNTVADLVETNRKLEVLEQFFNKKEAELQKQLGLQSARFGDVSDSADTTAKQLTSVTEELDNTKAAMKLLRCELEEQEKSLKAAVAVQEKKAHENWVAARQSERKLNDLQTEISTLRNRLTVTESKAQNLEQEKQDLQTTIQTIQQGKLEGVNGTSGPPPDHVSDSGSGIIITDPAALPPLPGLAPPTAVPTTGLPPLPGLGFPSLPTMMVPPMFPPVIDTRPPTLGRHSPPPRDSRERSDMSFRSTGRGGRDYSPSSRSERRGRRGPSPGRRPSPTRSDRGYYRDRDSSTDRSYRHEDRYERSRRGGDDFDGRRRDYEDDRHYDRRSPTDHYERRSSRDYSDNGRGEEYYERRGSAREYLDIKPGPKTSSPLEAQSRKFIA